MQRATGSGGSNPIEALTEVPEVPETLNERAREKWLTVMTVLVEHQMITEIDIAAVERYCDLWIKYQTLMRMDDPDEMPLATRLQLQIAAEMRKFEQDYGLSPSSRGKVTPASKPTVVSEEDKQKEAFLGG